MQSRQRTFVRQAGSTLLEALASIAIMSGVVLTAAELTDRYLTDTKAITAAQQLRAMGEAGRAYIAANQSTVLSRATSGTPCLIQATDLATFLPGFNGTNVYGQTLGILVLEPTANNLQALVIASGGETVDDVSLAQIANTVGGEGGAIYSDNANVVRGVGGSWSLTTSAAPGSAYKAAPVLCATGGATTAVPFAVGHSAMALWMADSNIASSFLYRDAVPGRPELNTLNTAITFSDSANQTANADCTTPGAISRDANGGLLNCSYNGTNTKWRNALGSQWKEAVANAAALPASGNTLGDVRLALDTSVIYTWDGGVWRRLTVDKNGDFTSGLRNVLASGSIQGQSVYSTTAVRADTGYQVGATTIIDASRNLSNIASVTASGSVRADSGFNVGGKSVVDGGGYLIAANTVAAGAGSACTTGGALARDSAGKLLFCDSATMTWVKPTAGGGRVMDSAATFCPAVSETRTDLKDIYASISYSNKISYFYIDTACNIYYSYNGVSRSLGNLITDYHGNYSKTHKVAAVGGGTWREYTVTIGLPGVSIASYGCSTDSFDQTSCTYATSGYSWIQ